MFKLGSFCVILSPARLGPHENGVSGAKDLLLRARLYSELTFQASMEGAEGFRPLNSLVKQIRPQTRFFSKVRLSSQPMIVLSISRVCPTHAATANSVPG